MAEYAASAAVFDGPLPLRIGRSSVYGGAPAKMCTNFSIGRCLYWVVEPKFGLTSHRNLRVPLRKSPGGRDPISAQKSLTDQRMQSQNRGSKLTTK